MKPVDYETFMAEKEEQESIKIEKPDSPALPIVPPKPKRAFGTPILIGAIVFLLIISFVGVYYSFSSFFEGGGMSGGTVAKVPKGSFHTVFVDSDYSVYNPKVDSWTPMKEGDIPFGVWTLTGNDSRRNLFTINKEHSIRADAETKFKIDEAKPTDNFKTKVIMEVENGDIWIEGAGDVFEVKTPRGTISGNGNNFQITMKDKSARILAWKGDLTFTSEKNPEKAIIVKEGKMLFVDSMDNMIPPPPNLLAIEENSTEWQLWNKSLKSEDLVGEKPVVAEIAKKVEVNRDLKEAVPVEDIKEPDVATDKTDKTDKKDEGAPPPDPSSELEKPADIIKKPAIPKIDSGPRVPVVGDVKYPTKTRPVGGKKVKNGKPGKPGEPGKPGDVPAPADADNPPPVPNELLDKPHQGAPGPENPQPVHKVHSAPGVPGGHPPPTGSPIPNPGGNVLDAPVQSKEILDNTNTKGKTLPPGMGIHGEPKGPSEQ